MTFVAVADAGPFIHLGEVDALSLLSLPAELHVPDAVYDELEAGGIPDGVGRLVWTRRSVEITDGIDELDAGETAALALAGELNATLLTDDFAAREQATECGIDVHGSIGVVVFGYARGRLERAEAATRMRSLQREASLFVTNAVVERGIELLDE